MDEGEWMCRRIDNIGFRVSCISDEGLVFMQCNIALLTMGGASTGNSP